MRLLAVCPPGGSFVIPVLHMFRGKLGLLRRGRLNLSMSLCQVFNPPDVCPQR